MQLTRHLVMHYQEFCRPDAGPRAGEGGDAVLILHGFYSNVSCWEDVAEELAIRSGRRCVVFDRIGFGLCSRPLRGETLSGGGQAAGPGPGEEESEDDLLEPYGTVSQARMALFLCRKLKIATVDVVAHDDAAPAAMLLASRERRAALADAGGASAGTLPEVRSLYLLHPNTRGTWPPSSWST